jgi:hypothetical protein
MSANLEQGKPALVIISSELVHVEVVQIWENEVQVRKADGSMSWRSIHNVAPLDPRLSLEPSEHEQAHAEVAEALPSAPSSASKVTKREAKRRADGKSKKGRSR